MSASLTMTFNDSDELSFNPTTVEVSGGTLRLLDLGGATYSTDNPTTVMAQQIQATALGTFAESATKPANTEIKYTLVINGNPYWFNTTSSTWEAATYGLYAESNTASEINTNLSTLLSTLSISGAFYVGLRVHLHSTGSARPVLTSITWGAYTFDYLSPATISECVISCYISDLLGDAYTIDSTKPATLYVQSDAAFMHGSKLIRPFTKTATFNSSGLAQLSVIETETPEKYVAFAISYYEGNYLKWLRFKPAIVPNQAAATLNNVAGLTGIDMG